MDMVVLRQLLVYPTQYVKFDYFEPNNGCVVHLVGIYNKWYHVVSEMIVVGHNWQVMLLEVLLLMGLQVMMDEEWLLLVCWVELLVVLLDVLVVVVLLLVVEHQGDY